jgi:hypothetical protein
MTEEMLVEKVLMPEVQEHNIRSLVKVSVSKTRDSTFIFTGYGRRREHGVYRHSMRAI